MKLVFLFTTLLFASGIFSQSLNIYTWDTANLLQSRAKALANDPTVTTAVNAVKSNADKYVNLSPVNVTQKTAGWQVYFPAGTVISPNDYVSFSTYYWPVPGHETDGTPWVLTESRGGDTTMDAMFDNARFVTMRSIINSCAEAYWFTDNAKYANAALAQLRAWFVSPATAMLPSFNHAGFAPFDSTYKLGSPYGLIDLSSSFPSILNSMELLKYGGYWTATDDSLLKKWCYNLTIWMQTSAFGAIESKKIHNNNHGIYFDALLVSQWLYLGNNYNGVDYVAKAKNYLNTYVTDARILYQIGNGEVVSGVPINGGMWEELSRPNASMYNSFAISGFNNLEILAKKVGIDLFNYNYGTSDPRSIRKALEFGIPYLEKRKQWVFGDTVKNPFTNSQVLWNMWVSSSYIPAQVDSFTNFILSQNDMGSLDKSDLNLLYPRSAYYSDDFLSVVNPAPSRKIIRGGLWATSNGELVLTNPASALTNSTPGNLCLHTSTIVGDYLINTNLKLTSNNTNDGVGVVFMGNCNSTTENYYYLLLSKSSANTGIYKVKGNASLSGTTRTKLSAIYKGIVPNTVYNIKIQRIGNNTIVLLNDSLIATITDISFLTGKTGFCTQNGTCSFQNIKVTKATASILPIKAVVADAKLDQHLVSLIWHLVGDEQHVSFQIEKSYDRINFWKIGNLNSNYSSNTEFSYVDSSIISGNIYYRIKAIASNGSNIYSDLVFVEVPQTVSSFKLFPNPLLSNSFTISSIQVKAGAYQIRIYNSIGQQIIEKSVSHLGGYFNQIVQLNSLVRAGIYRVVIYSKDKGQIISNSSLDVL